MAYEGGRKTPSQKPSGETRLFTISRNVFLGEETLLDEPPELHGRRNTEGSTTTIITHEDRGIDTVIKTLKVENTIRNHHQSPLFVRNSFIGEIPGESSQQRKSPVTPNHRPRDVCEETGSFLAPLKKLTTDQALKLENSRNTKISSSPNSSTFGDQERSRILSTRCGRPRFVPDMFDPKLRSADRTTVKISEKSPVEIHDSSRRVMDMGCKNDNQSDPNSSRWSFSARLQSFAGSKNQIDPSAMPTSLEHPFPLHVEDLRTESAGSQSQSTVALPRKGNSDFVQLQLEEIDERNREEESLNGYVPDVGGSSNYVEKIEEEIGEENRQRAKWMQLLPHKIRELPLHYLFIPGSHDSCSASLSWEEGVGPDVAAPWRLLAKLAPCVAQPAFMRWSVTQRDGLTDQLRNGVRYFDLRVAERGDRFLFVHGLYGDDMQAVLEEISVFLHSHPGEVALLDFQHLYHFGREQHEGLRNLIREVFKGQLCPVMPIQRLSLNYLAMNNYQVLVFYRSPSAHVFQFDDSLWPGNLLPNPWPQTTDVRQMLSFLRENLDQRNSHVFFVTQCVLTPSSSLLRRHLFSTLEQQMALPAHRATLENLPSLSNREGGCNVVMTDFVDHEDYALPRAVIHRNYEHYQ